ncbi:MAG TPA: class I SAM-dependent methyltransferase [Gammaproteobacteria bacterium]|nr:class I SAM-dependent methyltransferase [Gammaproteobacteria bacterium]
MRGHLKYSPGLDAAAIRTISLRYKGHWLQGYVRGKLRSDPVYRKAAGIIAAFPAPVLDIGCGPGLMAHYLDASGVDVPYTGLDADARKISSADGSIRGLAGMCFEHADCLTLPDWQGHVIILDVLHYLDAETQSRLLQAAISRTGPGASLVIRSVLRDKTWRFRTTQIEETFIKGSRWIPNGVKHYPRIEELARPMEEAGLVTETAPLYGHTPFNSYLIWGRRPLQA